VIKSTTAPSAANGGGSFVFETGYDATGRVIGRKFPDGDIVGRIGAAGIAWSYDRAGRLRAVPGAINAIGYNAAGQVTSLAYASGIATSYVYDPQRLWLNSFSHALGATVLLAQSYERDAAGRITAITASGTSAAAKNANGSFASWSYSYDDLDQLLAATNAGDTAQNQIFTYDVAYNLLSRKTGNGPVISYAYPTQGATAIRPHAPISVGGAANAYVYDANGNLTSGGGRSYGWNGENQLASVTRASPALTLAMRYAPDGSRLARIKGTERTLYLGADYERSPTGEAIKMITPDIKRQGLTAAASTTQALLRDHLASVRLVATASGAIGTASRYSPYGLEAKTTLIAGTSDSKGYIGERADAEMGISCQTALNCT
jgi:hypothetical protein